LSRQEKSPRPRADARANDVIANVSILSDGAQRILIGKNTSAAIDLKTDCDRAEIADPGVADIMVVSPRRVVVSGKAFGTTQMILRVGNKQRVFNVAVEHDLNLLTNVIRTTAPTANVQPRSVHGNIVLSGTVPDVQTGDRIAEMASLFQGGQVRNQLTVAGVQQTLLRVVVAEVNKEAIRQLGFNWAVGGSDWSKDFFFANNVGGINPTVFSSNGLPDVRTGQMTYSVSPTANIPPTNVTFGFPRAEFQVFMNALRQNSLARVLAEPNLVAISGQTATFLAGGEVPVPVTQGGAVAGSITIEYKEFGVRLAFTPTVLRQIIRLHVMSEVSDAIPGDTIAGGLPVSASRHAR
jgi:pilus assembly protein CpaC